MSATAEELAELTKELCGIPSETGHEKEIADHVQRVCAELAGTHSVERIGNSMICDPLGAAVPNLPTVALVGHLDTVNCADGQPTEIREGKVYGCGASDMKAGDAVMIALLRRWKDLKNARPVWIFYDKEEGAYADNGLEPVLRSDLLPALDFAFVLEPTDQTLHMGCMGTIHAVVTVHGRRGHSARPWQAENAIYNAIPMLERLSRLQRREVRHGELTYYEVMTATQIWTETAKNVVPERVMINVNNRFAPGTSSEDAEREVREIAGPDASIEIVDVSPAGDVQLGHPLIEPWREALGLELRPKQAWTDVGRLTEHGIAAVNFGPGETAQAHQSNEWCSIESLKYVYGAYWDFFTR